MMTCNRKTVSKVVGWGMILKMIRDKEIHRNEGRDSYRWDRLRSPGIATV
jgi:hypothetical protein